MALEKSPKKRLGEYPAIRIPSTANRIAGCTACTNERRDSAKIKVVLKSSASNRIKEVFIIIILSVAIYLYGQDIMSRNVFFEIKKGEFWRN